MSPNSKQLTTVRVPEQFNDIFSAAEDTVKRYFSGLQIDPAKASIDINGQRYVLVRASSLSIEFLESIQKFYADRGEAEAMIIGKNLLFDLAHFIGLSDAVNFHDKMNLKDPVARLSAGPVHFAYTGWASVDILPESNPSPDQNFFLKYHHPYSFEADAWIASGKKSDQPVCVMSAGYSSGWCEASFGIPLTAVEIECKAKGDERCTFIMAPPDRIENYVRQEHIFDGKVGPQIPYFLERKKVEEQSRRSLEEKEILLKEIHHRVKNNLQVITSLLSLQSAFIEDENVKELFRQSQYRINSMAFVHELLYQSENLSRINFGDYTRKMITALIQSMKGENSGIVVTLKCPEVNLSIDTAVPLGLLMNEVLTNSLKYGVNDKGGELIVELSGNVKEGFMLHLGDNGPGFEGDVNDYAGSSLGMILISNLVIQLEGKIRKDSKMAGTHYFIDFHEISKVKHSDDSA